MRKAYCHIFRGTLQILSSASSHSQQHLLLLPTIPEQACYRRIGGCYWIQVYIYGVKIELFLDVY
ncbi:hypothetical protein MTBSS4_180001 [Magnetospirillum sp. SS-4]|nr:hypothetical protein MTBSS4_180001 [Magnetospirillum sp. SS-4]